QSMPDVHVRHLASAEKQRNFHAHVVFQKSPNVTKFDAVIVLADIGVELEFLDLRRVLMLARLPFLPRLLISELAEVHDPTDGRLSVWRDLDQITSSVLRSSQRLVERYHSQLCPIGVDRAHFA